MNKIFSLGVKMKNTQISKSEAFALNFATMISMYNALKEVEDQPEELRTKISVLVMEAIVNHPNPAEA